MNTKEVGEIRRHIRRERSNITAIYGWYVNENKDIISQFRLSTGMMSENESEKYYGLLRKILSGSLGRNLIDISFKTSQVASGEEHKLLMALREDPENQEARDQFVRKVIESVSLNENYLILLANDRYDVPFRSKDGDTQSDQSEETYRYMICAVCPVKQTKPLSLIHI